MPDYGIELVDVQYPTRVNYIESVQAKVFERMISERKRIADRHRSEGQGKSAEIRGKKERELKVIESEAYRKTQEIMGRGDAEATAIYAAAYNKDRELYRFLRTMDTYKATIDKNSWLVLSTDADIFNTCSRRVAAAAATPRPARQTLMAGGADDPYAVLGVARSATQAEIKAGVPDVWSASTTRICTRRTRSRISPGERRG